MKKVWIMRAIVLIILHYVVDNVYAEIVLLMILAVNICLIFWVKRNLE